MLDQFFAIVLACTPTQECVIVEDRSGPKATREECVDRLEAMRDPIGLIMTQKYRVPFVKMEGFCLTKDQHKNLIQRLQFGSQDSKKSI